MMQIFPTRMCNVDHSMTSIETARSLANGPIVEGNSCVSYLLLALVALEESVGGA